MSCICIASLVYGVALKWANWLCRANSIVSHLHRAPMKCFILIEIKLILTSKFSFATTTTTVEKKKHSKSVTTFHPPEIVLINFVCKTVLNEFSGWSTTWSIRHETHFWCFHCSSHLSHMLSSVQNITNNYFLLVIFLLHVSLILLGQVRGQPK